MCWGQSWGSMEHLSAGGSLLWRKTERGDGPGILGSSLHLPASNFLLHQPPKSWKDQWLFTLHLEHPGECK